MVLAITLTTTAALSQGPPSVLVDGQPLRTAQPVLNREGVLLLPMRDVFEALHAQVRWYACERKIEARRGDDLLELWVGTPVANVNHNPLQLQVPPLLIGGVTYVPLRIPAEAFGGSVRWDAARRTALISSPAP